MLTPNPNPELTLQLPELTTSSVAHPDTWNPTHQTLLTNDAALHVKALQTEKELQGVRDSLSNRLAALEAGSAVDTQHALALDWLYRKESFYVEIWRPGFTLIEPIEREVLLAVQGDDSLDLSSTEGIQAGEHYVLTVPGEQPLVVKVSAVLTQSRVRIAQDLPKHYTGGQLTKTSFAIEPLTGAQCQPHDSWLSRKISLGQGGALIVRRTLNTADVRFYWRTATSDWQESIWVTRRNVTDHSGYADYEYSIPAQGDIWLRIDVAGEPVSIAHIVALGQATGHGGFINDQARPAQPVMASPTQGATAVSITPTLSVSGFSSSVGNRLGASKFQLATDANFATVAYETDWQPLSLSVSLARDIITPGGSYFVRAKVKDEAGLESDWSAAVQFTVAPHIAYVVTPAVLSPGAGALNVDDSPTVLLSAFRSDGGDPLTHKSTQIQVRKISDTWSTLAWNSGTLGSVTTVRIPASTLQPKTTYAIRARHQATNNVWSEWSAETSFTTRQWFISDAIGVAMVPEGSRYVLKHIDEFGRLLEEGALPKSYFDSHPVFGGMQDVLIEGNHMVKIPAFWYRRAMLTVTPYLTPVDTWVISPVPRVGFTLHAAFADYSDASHLFIGKYKSSIAYEAPTWGVKSQPNAAVRLEANWATVVDSFDSGWRALDYFDLACIQMLWSVEHASLDCRGVTGSTPYDESTGIVNSPAAQQASYRGIIGLWGGADTVIYRGIHSDNSSGYKVFIGRNQSDRVRIDLIKLSPSGYPVTFLRGEKVDGMLVPDFNNLTDNPNLGSVPSIASAASAIAAYAISQDGLWNITTISHVSTKAMRLVKHDQ